MGDAHARLRRALAEESRCGDSPRVAALRDEILRRHGACVAGMLFYGSALRDPEDPTRMLDFYVITDSYQAFHGGRIAALLNTALPPNVYYGEAEVGEGAEPVRSKYAVLSLEALERRTTTRSFESMFWGRFAQPTGIVYARDAEIRDRLVGALAQSCVSFISEALPLMAERFTARDLWVRAIRESYGTELRAERPGRAEDIYARYRTRCDEILGAIFAGLPETARPCAAEDGDGYVHSAAVGGRRRALLRWRLRRICGKTLAIFRIAKAAFTFDGGLAYILWKIESHSGVSVTPKPWQWRHPLLAAPMLAWTLYRKGAFR